MIGARRRARLMLGHAVLACVTVMGLGIGVARAAPGPVLTRSPSSLNFGNVQVATTSFGQFVSIGNAGDAPLTLGSLSLTGTHAAQFAFEHDACSGVSVSPGSSCSFSIEFAPTSTGAKNAGVSIPSNAPSSPDSVSLSGTGVSPALTRTPSNLSFGNQQIDTSSFSQFVSVQNTGTGNGPIVIGTVSIGGAGAAHFVIQSDSCSGATLSPSVSCQVSIEFAPTSTGAKTASLAIPSNAPTSPDPVSLSGTGVAAGLTRTPSALSFGNQQINTNSFDQFVSVQNTGTGNGPLTIGTVSVTSTGASHFQITSDTCSGATLSPSVSCGISIAFAPTTTGAKSASLSIPSNAPSSPDAVSLSGTGVNPSLSRSPGSLAFGDQQVGTSSFTQFVFLSNNGVGNGPVTIGTASISGAAASQFVIDSDTCSGTTLGPSQSCFLSIYFAPASTGPKAATLSIPSNAPSSPDAVSLSGTGIVAMSVTPSTVNFGSRELGMSSDPRTVTVSNVGDEVIQMQDASIAGTHATDFALASDTCTGTVLFPDEHCTMGVVFEPQALGPRSASLTISSDVASMTVALNGTGIDTTGPANTWSTTTNSIRVSTLQSVNGASADPSGVTEVSVRFTDLFGAQTTVAATLGPCTPQNRSCDWSATVPLMLPGPYTATILSEDQLGNTSAGPDITVIVV